MNPAPLRAAGFGRRQVQDPVSAGPGGAAELRRRSYLPGSRQGVKVTARGILVSASSDASHSSLLCDASQWGRSCFRLLADRPLGCALCFVLHVCMLRAHSGLSLCRAGAFGERNKGPSDPHRLPNACRAEFDRVVQQFVAYPAPADASTVAIEPASLGRPGPSTAP